MNKHIKEAFIFTGGVTVGTAVGLGLAVSAALKSKYIRGAIYDMIFNVLYGEEPVRRRTYGSYYSYTQRDVTNETTATT